MSSLPELIPLCSIPKDKKTRSRGFHKLQTALSVRQKGEGGRRKCTEMIKGLIMRPMNLREIMKIAGIYFYPVN